MPVMSRGCQHYPFPLGFFDYPKAGNFIGIVGNFKSGGFSKALITEFQKNIELPVVKLTVSVQRLDYTLGQTQ